MSPRSEKSTRKQILTLRAWILGSGLTIIGLAVLLLASDQDIWRNHTTWQVFLQQAGSALAVAGLLSVLWDVLGKRALTQEMYELARLGDDVRSAGLQRIAKDYQDLDWQGYLAGAQEVDLWVGYARTWRFANFSALQQMLRNPKARLRVVMPDPEDPAALTLMAQRFGKTPEEVATLMADARKDLVGLAEEAQATVEIYVRSGEPLHAMYVLGREAIVTLYSHQRKRGSTPVLVAQAGGELYTFLRADMDALIAQGRRVFPKPTEVTT